MSEIFEVFGYPLGSSHPDAVSHRKRAHCPFMEAPCDGGGNRYLSALEMKRHPELAKQFPGLDVVQAGVCSLVVKGKPWIVCPRRLLTLSCANQSTLQRKVREDLVESSGLKSGCSYKVWSEVKMKVGTRNADEESKSFDYTFDYVIAGRCRRKLSDVARIVGKSVRKCEMLANDGGYTLALREGELWVDDFPADPVVIVEVMTSSTSGGNKAKRTQIGMAFEDALLYGSAHEGPGINYRQVWARMVSQLIVKSQVGLAWGGKTLWVLQDVLTDYISNSTGLNLNSYLATSAEEVNILAFGYGEDPEPDLFSGIVKLNESSLFAGPISKSDIVGSDGGFIDIIKIGAAPPKEFLWRSLFQKEPCGVVTS